MNGTRHSRSATGNYQRRTSGNDQRNRYKFQILLDLNKPRDYSIAEALHNKRLERQMTPFVRDAVELLMALNTGDTTLLYQLYPHLMPVESPSQPALASALDKLAVAVEKMQAAPSALAASGGTGNLFSKPTNNDDLGDLLEMTDSTGDGKQAGQNLIASCAALQAMPAQHNPNARPWRPKKTIEIQ